MCLESLCIQDASLRIRLMITHFLFSRWGAGPCNPVWVALDSPTTMFDWCILKTRCILLHFSSAPWQKIWIKCTTCRLCVGNLLCTTEASNVQANLPLFPLWFSAICCRGEDRWWRLSLQIFKGFRIWGCTKIHETIEDQGSVSGIATERPQSHQGTGSQSILFWSCGH